VSDKSSAAGGGIGFFGLLGIVFIVLKLTNIINWDWWLVLLPIYGPILLTIIFIFVAVYLSERK
jgi:hypothetical protein